MKYQISMAEVKKLEFLISDKVIIQYTSKYVCKSYSTSQLFE